MNRVAWNVEKSGVQKNFEKMLTENFRSESFSIRTSRIESSRFRARVATGRPAFRDRITRGSLESKIVYRGVSADFEKQTKNIFSANNEQGQGSMKREEKWFSEKLRKDFDLENFRSESFSIRTSRIESSRFRARVATGRPAFRDRITRGKPRVQNCVSRGGCWLWKTKKNIFG